MGRFLTTNDLDALLRRHVPASAWADEIGTDYWLFPGTAVAGATTFLLSSSGWTTTSMGVTAGSAADLMSAADEGTPRSLLFNATGDLISSPVIFGDYQHAKMAAALMRRGDLPRYLILDALAAFTTASAAENTSGFGFVEDAGVITTAADQLACIVSDGTNFILQSGADSDAGIAVDNVVHWWRIVLDRLATSFPTDAVSWYIDGALQGTIDCEADEFPVSFAAHTLTTNRIALSTVHIQYAWKLLADAMTDLA